MTIHELEPKFRIGPLKIGTREGPKISSFPKDMGTARVTFQRGPIVLDVDRDLSTRRVSVTVINSHEVILDNDPALRLTQKAINEVPGLKRKLHWTPA